MIKAVILDLDDTVVNSLSLYELRKARKWKLCSQNYHSTSLYPGVVDFIDQCRNAGIKVGIVTASVSFYASGLLYFHGIKPDALVCYHDCEKRKPHPDPIFLCLSKLGVSVADDDVIGVGDSTIDMQAYNASGILSCGAEWSQVFQKSSEWGYIAADPSCIINFS